MTEKTAREEMLEAITRALRREGKSGLPGEAPAKHTSSQIEHLVAEIKNNCEHRRVELVEQFEAEATRVGAFVHRASSAGSAIQYIEQVAEALRARRIVSWEGEVIDGVDLRERLTETGAEFLTETGGREFIAATAAADIGVSGADYALADTGTLVLLARKGQARSISLLPPVHIAVVRPERVLSGLSDLFPLLYSAANHEGGDLSSAITLITGPSRTADIELTLVVGVHGPQQLHVILLDF